MNFGTKRSKEPSKDTVQRDVMPRKKGRSDSEMERGSEGVMMSTSSHSDPHGSTGHEPEHDFERDTEYSFEDFLDPSLCRIDHIPAHARPSRFASFSGYTVSETAYLSVVEKNAAAQKQIKKLRANIQRAQESEQALSQEIREMQESKQALLQEVGKMQRAAFESAKRNAPKAESDNVIREKLNTEVKRWTRFAKRWASHFTSNSSPSESSLLMKEVYDSTVAQFAANTAESILTTANMGELLLCKELSEFLSIYIMTQPFLALLTPHDISEEEGNRRNSQAEAFSDVLESIRKNMASANAWRSQTLSILDPPYFLEDSANEEQRFASSQRKEKYYESLVELFERSPAKSVLRDIPDSELQNRRDELLKVIRQVGEVFSALRTQKADIQVCGWEGLKGQTFTNGNEYMEAHLDHRLEERDHSLDGQPLQFVVSPAILAFGDESGGNYDKHKVWKKAIVCVKLNPEESTSEDSSLDIN